MQNKLHPTFATAFQKAFMKSVLFLFALLTIAFALIETGHELVGKLSLLAVGAAGIGVVIYFRYRVLHVHCPRCGKPCSTQKDRAQHEWTAVCASCDIRWHLAIGTKNTDW